MNAVGAMVLDPNEAAHGINRDSVAAWVEQYPLEPVHVDCATTVMLKILDGKCKMFPEEKVVMALLYDAVKDRPGQLLETDIHQLIAESRTSLTKIIHNEDIIERVYEQRLYAESMISRPVMKAFKAMIREKGLFSHSANNTDVS